MSTWTETELVADFASRLKARGASVGALFEALGDMLEARQAEIGPPTEPKLLPSDWLVEDDKLDPYRALLALKDALVMAQLQGLC